MWVATCTLQALSNVRLASSSDWHLRDFNMAHGNHLQQAGRACKWLQHVVNSGALYAAKEPCRLASSRYRSLDCHMQCRAC